MFVKQSEGAVKKCPQINENTYIRLFNVNSEKNKDSIVHKYPLYNFNEQSDWLFYDKSTSEHSGSFN